MLYVIAAILTGWAISGWTGFRWAGYHEKVVFRRHPAAACADCALSGHRFLEVIVMVLVLLACLAGCVLLPDGAVSLCEGVIVFLLAPLPYYFFDATRRDHRLRSFEFVHFNVLTPPTTHQPRESVDGRLIDVGAPLVFFISEKQWTKKKYISDTDKKYLATFMVAPGLYVTKVTNDVLQTFDSLNLYEHILNPENSAAVEAFRIALKDNEDLRVRMATLTRLSESEAPPAAPPTATPVAKKSPPTPAPAKVETVAPVVTPQVQVPDLEQDEQEQDLGEAEEEVHEPVPPPAPVAPTKVEAPADGRTLGITPPDLDPALPPVPGMTQMVGALNTPDKHKGSRKTRRKKTDPDQESLGLGTAPASQNPPATSPVVNNGGSSAHEP